MKKKQHKEAKQFTADSMVAVMQTLEELWPKMMVTLLVGPFHAGICNYASNGSRDDMIKALRETADRLESNEDKPRG